MQDRIHPVLYSQRVVASSEKEKQAHTTDYSLPIYVITVLVVARRDKILCAVGKQQTDPYATKQCFQHNLLLVLVGP
jgi:hypothetical protein